MTAAEKKMIEKNLDLLFEFEKYVLEDPEITEKIPRDRIHEIGRESKIQPVERALGETASQEGPTAHFRYGEETEPGSFAYQGTRFRACRLIRICSNRYVKPSVGGGKTPAWASTPEQLLVNRLKRKMPRTVYRVWSILSSRRFGNLET